MTKETKDRESGQKAYYAEDLIAIYSAFKEGVYSPRNVLYPSCGFDGSPAKVFSQVTFVDLENGNEGCIQALRNDGLNAVREDIRKFVPKGAFDLLILLNPAISHTWATQHLESGGYVIANNYHNTASELCRDSDFALYGTIDWVEEDRRKKDYQTVISRDLTGLFEPVSSFEEFKLLRPSDAEFTRIMVEGFARDGTIDVKVNATFDEKWRVFREQLQEGIPSKRAAERYIFVKK